EAQPESEGLQAAVLESGAAELRKLPQALSFLVLRNGTLVFESYFNGSSPTDSNNVHSSSKSILSLLVGIAVREGFIHDVDQPIGRLLSPELSVPLLKRNITLRHLLTMSAGLEWTEDSTESTIEKKRIWTQAILDLPLAHEPGKEFNYDTGLTHLVSAVLTQ